MPDYPEYKGWKSYIMSAYVKFMEQNGARVVPIIYGEDPDVIKMKVSKLDGILYPGGGGDYYEMGKQIFEQVKAINDGGQFYPLWATCLGFERLNQYTATAGKDILVHGLGSIN